ncbi:hypothetical protein DSL72_006666 [Monilinia vaccinii-corymbosi]|uniref:Uncharacterized protein n=1 Tax=Monilinia vaccinii-corymbosi TaxID=61207 RepID=A0A8A3PP37_9HELO|nr:hypothetical protein DSL72_006666 [Monilinia vaccinii-corymbosi]
MPGHELHGYSDYVVVHLINSMNSSGIEIKNSWLKHGKFHVNGNKDVEISSAEIDKIIIPPNSAQDISACGRSSALYGTEGSIELYDGANKIGKLYWSDPYSGDNDFQAQDTIVGGTYAIVVGNWNRSGGSLGRVDVEIIKKG